MSAHLFSWMAAVFDRWEAGWNATVTPLEVPFRLPVEPVNATTFRVLESGRARQRIAALFAWVFGAMAGTSMLFIVVLMSARAPFSAGFLVIWFLSASVCLMVALVARHVATEASLDRVVVLRPGNDALQLLARRGDNVEQQYASPLSACRLRIHPISFERWSRWDGFGAVLHMGTHQLVLACMSRRDELEGYVRGLPVWLQAIHTGDGSVIIGQGFLRAEEGLRLRRRTSATEKSSSE